LDLDAIVKALHLKILAGREKLTTRVKGGYTGDLLSDVMANSGEGDLWVTRQTHQNIIAVASLKEHAGIILTGGGDPAPETVARAVQENIPLLVSDRSSFALSGELYELITKTEGEPSSAGE
jgi:predicted transcriptional regulator